MKLTQTEMRIVEMYRRGARPREIAEILGVSINTVYKALSKARRVLGDVEPRGNGAPEARPVPIHATPVGVSQVVLAVNAEVNVSAGTHQSTRQLADPCQQVAAELLSAIRRLEGELAELKKMVASLSRPAQAPVQERQQPGRVPEFLMSNLWVDVLRSRKP